MSANIARNSALESFRVFMNEECTEPRNDELCLADYVEIWLVDGGGAEICCGKFEIFLKAVALIVDEWYRHPEILDCHGFSDLRIPAFPRRPTSAFGGEEEHAIFNVDFFASALWINAENRLGRARFDG